MDDAQKQERLITFARLRVLGENAYDAMCEAHSQRDIDFFYRDAKDHCKHAISVANELGLVRESAWLSERLRHIDGSYRSKCAG